MYTNLETNNRAPILVLAYNRHDMLKELLSLLPNDRKIYIHVDGPSEKSIQDVEISKIVATSFQNSRSFVETLFQEINLGNLGSFRASMEWVFASEEQVIVLEDDVRFSFNFFNFMDWALENFMNENRIFQINGLSVLDRFPMKEALYETYSCKVWGFGTWRDRWDLYKTTLIPKDLQSIFNAPIFNGVKLSGYFKSRWADRFERLRNGLDTYDFGWNYAAWANASCALSLRQTLTTNIGFDSRSTHTKDRPKFLLSKELLHTRRLKTGGLQYKTFPSHFDAFSDFIEWKAPGINFGATRFLIFAYMILRKFKLFAKNQ
jgi:hypothetical protein